MIKEIVLKLRPEEQYAEYLADKIRLAFNYEDWHTLSFDEKPDPVSSEISQTIVAAVISKKHN